MKEEKFEKVVESEYTTYSLFVASCIFFTILVYGFCYYLMYLVPEWNTSFFPIAIPVLGVPICIVLSYVFGVKRNIHWRKIK